MKTETQLQAVLTEITFEPEHYNRNCGCTISEAWTGTIEINDPRNPLGWTQIMGDSREEVIEICKAEGIRIGSEMKIDRV